MNEKYVDIPEKPIDMTSYYQDIFKKLMNRQQRKDDFCSEKIVEIRFKEFWNLCENPIPVVFKYKNHYLITRDTNKINEVIKMTKEEEMRFVELSTVPEKKGGRASKDWFSILSKIPVGKAWTPNVKGVQTIREAIMRLVKEKKFVEGQYEVFQRTVGSVKTVYVANYGKEKKLEKKA